MQKKNVCASLVVERRVFFLVAQVIIGKGAKLGATAIFQALSPMKQQLRQKGPPPAPVLHASRKKHFDS